MKAHIFLISNLKFRLQTPCSFGDMAENVKLIGIPINNFLCIYIITSSPGLHTLFCLWRVNKKLPQGETSQNTFQRSRSISRKCKIHMVKWAHPPLTWRSYEIRNFCFVKGLSAIGDRQFQTSLFHFFLLFAFSERTSMSLNVKAYLNKTTLSETAYIWKERPFFVVGNYFSPAIINSGQCFL